MPYATQADMVTRFGEAELIDLTDRDGSTGAIDSALVETALEDAASTIDGYVGRRYDLPLDPVPKVLTRLACDLARYFLYENRATEEAEKRHDDAIKLLRDISSGTVHLGASTPEQSVTGTPKIHQGKKRFDDDTMNDYGWEGFQ